MNLRTPLFFALALSLGGAGCGNSTTTTGSTSTGMVMQPETVPLQGGCFFGAFGGKIMSGPDMGTTLQGALDFGYLSDGKSVRGVLFLQDSKADPIAGTVDGTSFAADIWDTGGTFHVQGTLSVAGALCEENLGGKISGPIPIDSGSWIAQKAKPMDPSLECTHQDFPDGSVFVACTHGTLACQTTFADNATRPAASCHLL